MAPDIFLIEEDISERASLVASCSVLMLELCLRKVRATGGVVQPFIQNKRRPSPLIWIDHDRCTSSRS